MKHTGKYIYDGKTLIGRHEWCALPSLNIPAIRAKIDTGAKTSAIHAFNIITQRVGSKTIAHFDVHPLQYNSNKIVKCEAEVIDERKITSSNGSKESRYVINATLSLGKVMWDIELTLSDRDQLRFRLLLGREALKKGVLIDPNKSYLLGNVKNAGDLYGN